VAVLNRKNNPTSNPAGDTNISKGTLSKRCSETFDAALRESMGGQPPILFLLLLD